MIVSAAKWSAFTELLAKLATPVSTVILARLLDPSAFGVLVTITMVISFAEIFTDAGFQKYLIQHDFSSKEDLYKSTTVAFWSNLILSLIIWCGIIVWAEEIAACVGSKKHGNVIAVACVCIPLAAFSSIQSAIIKRAFDFKSLFWVRIIGCILPVIITIPIAYITRSFWSLVIGMIAQQLSAAIILTLKSEWKIRIYYSWERFKKMFSFSSWTLLETLSIWLTGYIDLFIIGVILNEYYLGVYRVSITTVSQILAIVTAATTPVLFSALSRLQNDDYEFVTLFSKFLKRVAALILPMGVGIFLLRDTITFLLLGEQWKEASYFLGLWGITSAFVIILSHYSSEVYRAKGKPQISLLVQLLHLIFLIPCVMWAIGGGFDFFCEMRCLVRFQPLFVNAIFLYYLVKISLFKIVYAIRLELFASVLMAICAIALSPGKSVYFDLFVILPGSIAIYAAIILLDRNNRDFILAKKYLKL